MEYPPVSDDNLKTILDRLEQLENDIDKRFMSLENDIDKRFMSLENDMDKRFMSLESDIKEVKITSEAYQKASTQIVSLAFGLISAAAAVVILSPAVKVLTEFFLSK